MKLKPKMALREALYIRQCYDILEGIIDSGEEGSKKLFIGYINFFLFEHLNII